MATKYKFCFGPWNLSEGQDPYGPPTRPVQTFDWKLDQLKKLGFDAMMFHDDDAVPDIDGKTDAQLRKEAKQLKQRLDDAGVAAEMVAPFLKMLPSSEAGFMLSTDEGHATDGAKPETSNSIVLLYAASASL